MSHLKKSRINCIVGLVFSATLSSWPIALNAETQSEETFKLFDMSLQELLAVRVSVASNKARPVREQPGVVSLITEQQIIDSGARNLQQILKQVPGLWITGEVTSIKAMSFRGIATSESKALLMVDGVTQNDLAQGVILLGNHYAAANIKQVEIIRGSGSVIYGGQAALMVIKVTTKGSEQAGTQVQVSADFTKGNIHNNNYTISSGHKLDSGLSYSLSALIGHGDQANDTFTGVLGNSVALKDNSNTRPLRFNSGLSYQNLDMRFSYDNHEWQDRLGAGGLGLFFPDPGANAFTEFSAPGTTSVVNKAASAAYRWQVSDKFSLQPTLTYRHSSIKTEYPGRDSVNVSDTERLMFNGQGIYEWSDKQNLLMGLNAYVEKYQLKTDLPGLSALFDGDDKDKVEDYALYLQYEADSPWANLILGARYEDHSLVGDAFVPRLAATKTWDRFHLKLMYNEAFKVPQSVTFHTAKLSGSPITREERTTNSEIELGYQYSDSLMLQGNLFSSSVDDFVGWDPTSFTSIVVGDISTWGGEFMLQSRHPWGMLDMSYSFHQIDKNSIESIRVEADKNQTHGIANQKLTLNMTYRLADRASLNLNGTVLGSRYGIVGLNQPKKIDKEYEFNLFYRKTYDQWHFGVGLANLFDTSIEYLEPFNGSMAATPGLGRRLMVNFGRQL